jgi:hypothetical protein
MRHRKVKLMNGRRSVFFNRSSANADSPGRENFLCLCARTSVCHKGRIISKIRLFIHASSRCFDCK